MKTWNLNKSTATNGIATWNDLPKNRVNTLGKELKQCPTLGAIASNLQLNVTFKYDGLLVVTSNKKLAVYSKCQFTSGGLATNYTITFSSSTFYGMIFLANTTTLTGNEIQRAGISNYVVEAGFSAQMNWDNTNGLSVNNGNTTNGTVKMFKGDTVYLFTHANNKFTRRTSFTLALQNQTVNF